MRFDIRTAALDELLEQRLRLAVSLLGSFRIRANVTPWDGTRCDLLVAAANDRDGQEAVGLAERRGMGVLALGSGWAGGGVDESRWSTAAGLAMGIRDRLERVAATDREPSSQLFVRSALFKLTQPSLRGRSVDACCNGRVLALRPKVGRVYAASHSDLLIAGDALMSGDCWRFDVVESSTSNATYGVSASIESVLMSAAYGARVELPDFADGSYRLNVWPDMGHLAESGPMKVAHKLISAALSPDDLVRSVGVDRATINACLWAFAAADLLVTARAASALLHTADRSCLFWNLTRRLRRLSA